MKKWVFIVVVLLICGVGGIWVLGKAPEDISPAVRAASVVGTAEVKAPGAATWSALVTGAVVPIGASIRTGENARVTLDLGDQAESRLGANSEIVIDQATFSTEDQADADVTVTVAKGRIWSRVLRLFDLDSRFTVKTNDVVATVRGTAFDLEKRTEGDETVLWVSQSAVETGDDKSFAAEASADHMVAEGFMRHFKKGAAQALEPIPSESFQGAWVKDMRQMDADFLLSSLREPKSAGGSGWVASLARWSQGVRIKFLRGPAKARAMQKLLQSQWLALRDQAEQGKVGEATQNFSKLLDEAHTTFDAKDPNGRRLMRRALFRAWLSFEDVGPNDPAYRLKQKVEEALGDLTEGADDAAYLRLLGLDARVDEALASLDRKEFDTAQKTVDLVRQGLENVERDVKGQGKAIPPARRRALLAKDVAVHVRLDALRSKLKTAMEKPAEPVATPTLNDVSSTPPVVNATATPVLTPAPNKPPTTAPVPVPTPVPTPTPTPQPTVKNCVGVTVSVQPNVLELKQSGSATAFVNYDDGSRADVTKTASFLLLGQIGVMNGNVFTATAAGSAQIQASVSCPNKTVTGSTGVQVNAAAVTPTRFSMGAQPPTVSIGGTVNLTAAMQYSDGSSKTVTSNVSFSSSDGSMGTVQGNVFTAGRQTGTVIVNASYDEAGQKFSDGFTITITK